MKPYPGILDNATLEELLARRRSGLEPRDDSVPAELQDEDKPLPLDPLPSWFVGVGIAISLVLGFAVWIVAKLTIQTS